MHDISPVKPSFYDGANQPETARLRLMADNVADKISLGAMSGFGNGDVVVDYGSGDSPFLGQKLKERGLNYVPIDRNPASVATMKQHGFSNAVHQLAEKPMPIDKGSIDVAHARFLFGWLNPDEQKDALYGMFEAVGSGRVIIIDYDWSSSEGPEELNHAIAVATQTLREFGFNPNFGEELHVVTGELAEEYIHLHAIEATVHAVEIFDSYEGPISEASTMVKQTAGSLIDKLDSYGMWDKVEEMQKALLELEHYIKSNPDTPVKLPKIYLQKIDLDTPRSDDIESLPEKECPEYVGRFTTTDYHRVLEWTKGNIAVIAKSKPLIDFLRRLQADAYVKAGLVDRDSLANGLLPDSVDPPDQVERSVYYTVGGVSEDRFTPLGFIRFIVPDSNVGVRSLPSYQHLTDLEKGKIGDRVIELSALAKDELNGSIEEVIGAIMTMASDVVDSNVWRYVIMSLETSNVRLFKALFGDGMRLSGDAYQLEMEGVNESKSYQMVIVDAQDFFPKLTEHLIARSSTAEHKGREVSPMIKKMLAISDNQQDQ